MESKSKAQASYLTSIIDSTTSSLEEQGNKSKIKQMEKYLKNKVQCYGNSNPNIYSIYKTLKGSVSFKSLNQEDKFSLGILFLKQSHFDHKLIASCILADLVKKIRGTQIEILKETIKEGTVNNWAVCDALASKVCKVYALLSKANTIYITEWKKESNIWLSRMSCVAFVNRIKYKDSKPNFSGFIELMFSVCEETILSQERFVQLGTGWLLRELALVDYERYYNFYTEHFEDITREAMRYSIEKLPEKKKKEILCYRGRSSEKGS